MRKTLMDVVPKSVLTCYSTWVVLKDQPSFHAQSLLDTKLSVDPDSAPGRNPSLTVYYATIQCINPVTGGGDDALQLEIAVSGTWPGLIIPDIPDECVYWDFRSNKVHEHTIGDDGAKIWPSSSTDDLLMTSSDARFKWKPGER